MFRAARFRSEIITASMFTENLSIKEAEEQLLRTEATFS